MVYNTVKRYKIDQNSHIETVYDTNLYFVCVLGKGALVECECSATAHHKL